MATTDSGNMPVAALTQSAQEVDILQLTSPYHGSSKRACRILLSRALYPSIAGAGQDPKKDNYSAWEPFLTTMIWPLTNRVDHACPTWDQLRTNGFELIT